MSDFNTEIFKALAENKPIEEVFRSHLESAVNELLKAELTGFLGYEKNSIEGHRSGNSRNGYYPRSFDTRFGTLKLNIPRDRNGDFSQHTLPEYKRRSDNLETTVIQLYSKGITTREIADLIEKMYGQHYSPATVSNIAKTVSAQTEAFHKRPVEKKYAVIYLDATYINLRRDSVAKEALHVVMGITPEGHKEILDYGIYPTEAAANYAEMLDDLKNRGMEQVLLCVSDGLSGIKEAVARIYPKAQHQQCWIHISRTVARRVRAKDRSEVLEDLKCVYRAETADAATRELEEFLEKYRKAYPRLKEVFGGKSLFSYFLFPVEIRGSIYTTNIMERVNKSLKHRTKQKEQFPDETSLDRFVCTCFSEYNRRESERTHRGFKQALPELLTMFDKVYGIGAIDDTDNVFEKAA